jgi:hypothetical protein
MVRQGADEGMISLLVGEMAGRPEGVRRIMTPKIKLHRHHDQAQPPLWARNRHLLLRECKDVVPWDKSPILRMKPLHHGTAAGRVEQ